MDGPSTLAFYGLGAVAVATSVVTLRKRLELSQAKHRSLAGHSRLSRRIARLLPFYEYDEGHFFASDDAPDEVVARRRAGFDRLSALYRTRLAETIRRTAEGARLFPICNLPTPIGCRFNIADAYKRICRRPPSSNRRAA